MVKEKKFIQHSTFWLSSLIDTSDMEIYNWFMEKLGENLFVEEIFNNWDLSDQIEMLQKLYDYLKSKGWTTIKTDLDYDNFVIKVSREETDEEFEERVAKEGKDC